MPATVLIRRWTGTSPGTPTDITGINTRANAYDGHSTADTASPVQIPGTGITNYSYWVSTRLFASTTPTTMISNLRWYADGTNNFGAGIGCVGNDAPTYLQATGTTGTGNQLTVAAYPALTAAPSNVFSWNVGAAKTVPGTLNNPATGDIGSFFVYQVTVDGTSALPGATTPETFTWKYDES